MSRPSEKARMREALRLTEGNLGSLIAARVALGLGDFDVIGGLLTTWRDVARKALSDWGEPNECICPKCGLRHGGRISTDTGF